MFAEDDFLMLSALQHFVFCQRQCALIHIEQAWTENMFTAQGRILHDKVHEQKSEVRKDCRVERDMPIHSFELGLVGKTDVVEFHRTEDGKGWIPFPVEYKRGKPKQDDSRPSRPAKRDGLRVAITDSNSVAASCCDTVQLCAQAMCIEEMLKVSIQCGAIFYGRTKHRLDVQLDEALRQKTKGTVRELHSFLEAGKTPAPVYAKKCETCSFIDECLPKIVGKKLSVKDYLKNNLTTEGTENKKC